MCVCVCLCLFLCVWRPHQSPSPWLIRCLSDGGPSRCLNPCLGPLKHEASHFSGRRCPGPGPGQLGYTQDKRAGVVPASWNSRGERAGQAEEGEEGEEEAEDDLRGVSILNNLLMGLPSISNFGRKVVRAVVTHVFLKRGQKGFQRGHSDCTRLILQ